MTYTTQQALLAAESARMNEDLSVGTTADIPISDAPTSYLQIWAGRIKEKFQDISGGNFFIVEHPDYGQIGTQELLYNDPSDYITETKVYNSHELFPESFNNTRFIDTTVTTATVDLTNHYVIF